MSHNEKMICSEIRIDAFPAKTVNSEMEIVTFLA